jgi:hypothetical protein
MDGLKRVCFRFGLDVEVRFLSDIPEPGHFVSHRAELWIVVSVEEDVGGTIVICELPTGDGRDLRLVA